MNWKDIIRLAWISLWRRKVSTILNLTGIVIGASILLLSIAGLSGVESAFRTLFDSSEFAREVEVRPSALGTAEPPAEFLKLVEELPDSKRERIKKLLTTTWRFAKLRLRKHQLTRQDLNAVSSLEGVQRTVVEIFDRCDIVHDPSWMHPRPELALLAKNIFAGSTDVDQRATQKLLVAGSLPVESNRKSTIAISEILAFRMGYVTDQELDSLLGQEITLRFGASSAAQTNFLRAISSENSLGTDDVLAITRLIQKVADAKLEFSQDESQVFEQLQSLFPKTPKPESAASKFRFEKTFSIGAILRFEDRVASVSQMFRRYNLPRDVDIMLHHKTMKELWVEHGMQNKFRSAKLVIDSTNRLETIEDQIKEKNLTPHSALWAWERIEKQINATGIVIYTIGIVILLSSALGITNTLLASVVQRTREFGILKSLGLRDRDLGWLVIFEGIVLGVVGSVLATIVAIVLASVGHQVVAEMIAERAGEPIQGRLIEISAFAIAITFAATLLICCLASLYPALRAARLQPVDALRHQ